MSSNDCYACWSMCCSCFAYVWFIFCSDLFFLSLQCAVGDTFTTLCYFQHLIETESTTQTFDNLRFFRNCCCKHSHLLLLYTIDEWRILLNEKVQIFAYFLYWERKSANSLQRYLDIFMNRDLNPFTKWLPNSTICSAFPKEVNQ